MAKRNRRQEERELQGALKRNPAMTLLVTLTLTVMVSAMAGVIAARYPEVALYGWICAGTFTGLLIGFFYDLSWGIILSSAGFGVAVTLGLRTLVQPIELNPAFSPLMDPTNLEVIQRNLTWGGGWIAGAAIALAIVGAIRLLKVL